MPVLKRLLQLLSIATIALVVVATAAPAADAPGGASPGGGAAPQDGGSSDGPVVEPQPLRLHAATLRQDGSALVLGLSTSSPWSPASLRRTRSALCLRLVYETGAVFNSRDVCVRRRGAATTLTLARVLRSGADGPLHELSARVSRPSRRALVARFSPESIGIPFGPLRWRVLSSLESCRIGLDLACYQALPTDGAVLTLRAPQPVGCTPTGPAYVTNGSRAKKVVALTFDDGPSTYTPAVLDVLKSKGIHGTFFMIGQQVAGNASVVRRMLAEGNELGDHTWSHPNVSGGGSFASGQISSTASAIEQASGYRPCSFRAPYGAVSSALTGLARGMGFTTIEWDVDPQDWATPGTDAIYSRIVGNARNGSIILMHDGGGPRSQTLAALPRVIDTLRARGYRFATVSELLGEKLTFR